MDIKFILNSPEEAIQQHQKATGDSVKSDKVLELVQQLKAQKKSEKSIKKKKQLCSKEFKEFKGDGEKIALLKEQMQSITRELESLEAQQKQTEGEILAQFGNGVETKEPNDPQPRQDLPSQFQPYSRQDQQQRAGEDISPAQIIAIDDDREADWNQYVSNHPNASLYHQYSWRKVIAESFHHPSIYLVAQDNRGNIVGLLPLIWLKSRLFGSFSISIPFFNYGGPLCDNDKIAIQLLNSAKELISKYQWEHIEIRTTQPGYAFPYRDTKASMIRRLPTTEDDLDKEIGSKVRAQIKQGAVHSPQIIFGSSELLNDFYQVFSIHMRDLGTPVYSRDFFANILKEFPSSATLVVVRLGGEPVAAAFLIGHREMLEIPWASTLKKTNKLNMNMWMYRQILGYAIDKGYQFFDFGRSTIDAGTFRFKKQWGAAPVKHYWYYLKLDDQAIPELNPNNPKYKLLIAIWKRLPVAISNLIGPLVVKFLP